MNLSWAGYRKVRKGVKKRINRHMTMLRFHEMDAYLGELRENDAAREEAGHLMTVSISRFFRDRNLWDRLKEMILPALLEKVEKRVGVWSAGCARGEEPYSFMILWDQMRKAGGKLPELSLTATDVNPDCIRGAREGIYTRSSFREVDERIIGEYFEKVPGKKRYIIKEGFRKEIRWEQRDIGEGPPSSRYHLVFLRNNLLTYYLEPMKSTALEKVLDALIPGGVLVVGAGEKPPQWTENLLIESRCRGGIFFRK